MFPLGVSCPGRLWDSKHTRQIDHGSDDAQEVPPHFFCAINVSSGCTYISSVCKLVHVDVLALADSLVAYVVWGYGLVAQANPPQCRLTLYPPLPLACSDSKLLGQGLSLTTGMCRAITTGAPAQQEPLGAGVNQIIIYWLSGDTSPTRHRKGFRGQPQPKSKYLAPLCLEQFWPSVRPSPPTAPRGSCFRGLFYVLQYQAALLKESDMGN